jgi:hypothetical protein
LFKNPGNSQRFLNRLLRQSSGNLKNERADPSVVLLA